MAPEAFVDGHRFRIKTALASPPRSDPAPAQLTGRKVGLGNPSTMNRLALSLLIGIASSSVLTAQTPSPSPTPPVPSTPPPGISNLLNEAELDQLFGPIALYPDVLIALILPASTEPTSIVIAARHLAAGGNAEAPAAEAWPESTRGLARYPDVITWLDSNLSWTQRIGDAFISQPADVMNSLQRLRARARAAGTLVDSPQQRIVIEETVIRIVPARPEIIYVPRYDPAVVFVYDSHRHHHHSSTFISFSLGYPTGVWLSYGFDWPHRTIWVVNNHHHAHYYHDSHYNRRPNYLMSPGARVWTPPPSRVRQVSNRPPGRGDYYQPSSQRPLQTQPPARLDRPRSSPEKFSPPPQRNVAPPARPSSAFREPSAPSTSPVVGPMPGQPQTPRPSFNRPQTGQPQINVRPDQQRPVMGPQPSTLTPQPVQPRVQSQGPRPPVILQTPPVSSGSSSFKMGPSDPGALAPGNAFPERSRDRGNRSSQRGNSDR